MLLFIYRQGALTAAIGEKDAHIALLELNRKNPKASEELKVLKKEKDDLVRQLKEEVSTCMNLTNLSDGLFCQILKVLISLLTAFYAACRLPDGMDYRRLPCMLSWRQHGF